MRGNDEAVDALLLAETLAARLCHDLGSPAGALVNAIEELHDDSPEPSDALALAQDAGTTLVRRLRLLRAAWGRGGAPMGVAEWHELAQAACRPGLRLDLDGMTRTAGFSPAAGRLMLNIALLAAESLPAGGVVAFSGHPDQDVVVRIVGPRAAWPAGLAMMLVDPAAAPAALVEQPRLLQAALTAQIAQASGQRVSLLMGPSDVTPPLLVCLSAIN